MYVNEIDVLVVHSMILQIFNNADDYQYNFINTYADIKDY